MTHGTWLATAFPDLSFQLEVNGLSCPGLPEHATRYQASAGASSLACNSTLPGVNSTLCPFKPQTWEPRDKQAQISRLVPPKEPPGLSNM